MFSGRIFGLFLTASSTALAGLAAASLYLSLQHEAEMRRMMGGMMHGMGMPWIPLSFAALLVVAAVVPIIVYVLALDRGGVKFSGLTYAERAVVDYLLQRGGQATQREIAQALNMSRLKVHRLVTSLKRRDIITTTPFGRTNKVTINKDHTPEQP